MSPSESGMKSVHHLVVNMETLQTFLATSFVTALKVGSSFLFEYMGSPRHIKFKKGMEPPPPKLNHIRVS